MRSYPRTKNLPRHPFALQALRQAVRSSRPEDLGDFLRKSLSTYWDKTLADRTFARLCKTVFSEEEAKLFCYLPAEVVKPMVELASESEGLECANQLRDTIGEELQALIKGFVKERGRAVEFCRAVLVDCINAREAETGKIIQVIGFSVAIQLGPRLQTENEVKEMRAESVTFFRDRIQPLLEKEAESD